MDGWVTIGVKADTSKFDRQIADLEKKMKEAEDKSKQYSIDISEKQENIGNAKRMYEELPQDIDETISKMQSLAEVLDSTSPDAEGYEELKQKYEEITLQLKVQEQLYARMPSEIAKQEAEVERLKGKQEGVNQKADEYAQKIEQVKMQKHIAEVEEAKKSFEGVGKSIQNSIKSISRFALSLIGIRSILLGIRQMASTLSQYNEDLANKIEAIKLALASALAPIVEFVVDMLTKAVALLGYVLKMLFGIDIFANASAMSLRKASGSAKELRKQLAGFDEMNVLNADGTTNLGGVSGLSKAIQDMNGLGESMFEGIKRWLFGDPTKNLIEKTVDAFRTMDELIKETFKPFAKWVYDNVWMPIKQTFGEVIKTFEPLLTPLKEAWDNLVNNTLKPMWDGFVDYMKPNVVDPILDTFRPIGREIYNFIVPYANAIIDMINQIFGVFGIHLDHWEYKTEQKSQEVKEDIVGAMNGAKQSTGEFKNVANANLSQFGDSADKQGDKITGGLGGALVYAGQKAAELSGKKIDIQTDMTGINNVEWGLDNILNDLWELVKKPWNIVTKIVAQGSSSLNNFLKPLRDTLSNIGIKLPFLASGGIVNLPNKGTYVGGAMAGESGRERSIAFDRPTSNGRIGKRNRQKCISKLN